MYCILDEVISMPEASHTLLSLSLVSTSFRGPAQHLLFRRPSLPPTPEPRARRPDTLSTYPRILLLKQSLEARPDLAAKVHVLDFGVWSTRIATEVSVDRRIASALQVDLLKLCPTACPNLREISWPGVVKLHSADALLALQHLANVETLRFGDVTSSNQSQEDDSWLKNLDPAFSEQFGSARPTVQQVGRVVSRWPRLRKLVLAEPMQEKEEWESAEGEAWSCELESLEVAGGEYTIAELEQILGASRDSLRRLTVAEHQLSPQDLFRLLAAYGAGLNHLTLGTPSTPALLSHPLLLSTITKHCAHLRHLSIAALVDPFDALRTLARLPHLETVKLAASAQEGQLDEDIMRELRMLPCLRELELEWVENEVEGVRMDRRISRWEKLSGRWARRVGA